MLSSSTFSFLSETLTLDRALFLFSFTLLKRVSKTFKKKISKFTYMLSSNLILLRVCFATSSNASFTFEYSFALVSMYAIHPFSSAQFWAAVLDTVLSSWQSPLLPTSKNGKFAGSLTLVCSRNIFFHTSILLKLSVLVISNTRIHVSVPLKYLLSTDLNLSCPAVSQSYLKIKLKKIYNWK